MLKSTVRFVRRELGNMAGEEGVRAGANLVGSALKTLRDRAKLTVCPSCGEGRLHPMGIVDGADLSGFVGCNSCEYFQRSTQQLSPMRAAANDSLRQMSDESRHQICDSHARLSRMFYVVALLFLGVDIYLLSADGSGISILCLSGFGIALLAKGIRSAYRCWQVREGRLFEDGLFKQWLRAGEWLV